MRHRRQRAQVDPFQYIRSLNTDNPAPDIPTHPLSLGTSSFAKCVHARQCAAQIVIVEPARKGCIEFVEIKSRPMGDDDDDGCRRICRRRRRRSWDDPTAVVPSAGR
jgi:hypothetical protein